MSKIRVDEIVNKTDDGSPSFPQSATSIEPTMDSHVVTKSYVDSIAAGGRGSNISISAPANPTIGSFWTDTSSDPYTLNIWDGSNWIEFSGTVDDISSKIAIETPNVLTPTDNQQNVYPVGVSLTSSTPASFIVGREQTSISAVSTYGDAEWQLAEDSEFTTNLQTLTSPLTSTGTQSGPTGFAYGFDMDYYVRTKYSSSFPSNVFSDWSPTNTFKTSVFIDYYWLSILGGGKDDYSSDIAVNSTNPQLPTIYVAGYSNSDSNNDYDAVVAKYDSLGNLVWKRKLRDGSYNNHDYARGVATDSSDNVYICGDTTRYTAGSINLNATSPLGGASWNRIEAFVAKYDSSGNIQWQRGLGGYGKQYFSKITLDSSGNLYAVGRANGELLIAKYDSSGNILWYRTYSDAEISNNEKAYGNGIDLDSSGNIYVAGHAYVVSNTDENGNAVQSEAFGAYLWKFDSAGGLLWQRRLRTPYETNYGNGVKVDASDNVYLTGSAYAHGRSTSPSYSVDALLAKYDSSGTLQWYRTTKTSGSGSGSGKNVGFDSAGNVIMYASFHNGSSPRYLFDAALIKFNSSGTIQFSRRFGGTSHDYAGAMTMDALENVYMLGHGSSKVPHGGSVDMMVMKVPNDGSQTGSWFSNTIAYQDASSLISDSTSEVPLTEEPGSLTETSLSLTDYDFGYVSAEIGLYSDKEILNP